MVDYVYWAFVLIPIIFLLILFWVIFKLFSKKKIEEATYKQEYIKEKARLHAQKEFNQTKKK